MVAENTSLNHLSIRGMNISAEGLASICEGLKQNKSIQSVDLSDNYIGPEAVPLLVDLLEVNHSITYLKVSNNNLEYQGEQAIRSASSKRKSVFKVDLQLESYGNYVYESMLNSVVMGIGIILSSIAFILLAHSLDHKSLLSVRLARYAYGLTLIFSFLTGALMHATHQSKRWLHKLLKVLYHCSNYLLIAAMYTVIIEEGLKARIRLSGYLLLGEYGCCLAGVVVHTGVAYWRESDWLAVAEAALMLAMGWAGLLVAPWALALFSPAGVVLVFVGGGLLTAGVGFYFAGAVMPIWRVIFSVLVIFGSLTLFVGIFFYMDVGGKTMNGTVV